MNNIFVPAGLGVVSYGDAVRQVPSQFGRVGELGLFRGRGIDTTMVAIESLNGTIGLIPMGARGKPPYLRGPDRGAMRGFRVPHIKEATTLTAEDIQDRRAPGTENMLANMATARAQAMVDLRSDVDITIEHMRVGALRGLLLDSDGTEVLDFYDEFGVTQKSVDFVLGTAGTSVIGKVHEVTGHIDDNLQGDVMTGVHALVTPAFYDKLKAHANVEKTYINWQAARDLRGDWREAFNYGGMTFEIYRGKATGSDGNVHPFIPDGEGIAFPLGTRNTFQEYWAPADYPETANIAPDSPFYAREWPADNSGRSRIFEVQANLLPVCVRPGLLVRLYSST